jgi:hypothetical protein
MAPAQSPGTAPPQVPGTPRTPFGAIPEFGRPERSPHGGSPQGGSPHGGSARGSPPQGGSPRGASPDGTRAASARNATARRSPHPKELNLLADVADDAEKMFRVRLAPGGPAYGTAVQVDSTQIKLKVPGTTRLKLQYDEPLSNVAFSFNLRHYTMGTETASMQRPVVRRRIITAAEAAVRPTARQGGAG